jgi:SSS family solute:Na+ symporter
VLLTIPSGFNSVAWTDFIFGAFMLLMCIVTAVLALSMGGGWSNIVAALPDKAMADFPGGLWYIGWPVISLWIVAATPGLMTNQMSFQRVCAADSARNARKTIIIGAIFSVLIEIWAVIIGLSVRALNPNIEGEMATGWFLTQIPLWALALFCGFIAVTIITTADSALQSVCVNLSKDIYKKYLRPGADDKTILKFTRFATCGVAALAVLVAITFPQVLGLIVATYAYSASGLLVPIYFGYIFRKTSFLTPAGGIASMAGGFIGCGIAHAMKTLPALSEFAGFVSLPYAIYGIAISFLCLIVVSLVTKKHARAIA